MGRIYTANYDYFSQPIDERRAYWLGWMASDGWVTGNNGSLEVGLCLQKRDRYIIEELRRGIQSTHPIKEKDDKYSRIRIASRKMGQDLSLYNISQRKSLIIRPPTNIPDEFQRYFWLGEFEGDGYIGRNKRGGWALTLVGTKWMINGFSQWVGRSCGNYHATIGTAGRVCRIDYQSIPSIYNIMKALYDGMSFCLKRKQKYLIRLKQAMANQYVSPTDDQKNAIKKLYLSGMSVEQVKERIGLSRSSIDNVIHEQGIVRNAKEAQISRPDRIPLAIRQMIAEEYKKGELLVKDIADKFNTTVVAVLKIAKEFGVGRTLRQAANHWRSLQERPSNVHKYLIINLYKEGQSILDIAKKLSVNHGVPYKVIKQAGILRTRAESQHLRRQREACNK